MTMVRGASIGSLIGIILGAGTGIVCFIAYNEEKRFSKRPEDFGSGAEEGISTPESANNFVSGACRVSEQLSLRGLQKLIDLYPGGGICPTRKFL